MATRILRLSSGPMEALAVSPLRARPPSSGANDAALTSAASARCAAEPYRRLARAVDAQHIGAVRRCSRRVAAPPIRTPSGRSQCLHRPCACLPALWRSVRGCGGRGAYGSSPRARPARATGYSWRTFNAFRCFERCGGQRRAGEKPPGLTAGQRAALRTPKRATPAALSAARARRSGVAARGAPTRRTSAERRRGGRARSAAAEVSGPSFPAHRMRASRKVFAAGRRAADSRSEGADAALRCTCARLPAS